jgi:hypothetical protein
MRLEVDIFSGRPNPAWQLGDVEARRIAAAVAGLEVAPAPPAVPDGLGFRGFVVTVDAGELAAWRELVVYDDHIVARGEGGAVALQDPTRAGWRAAMAAVWAHDPELATLVARLTPAG